MKRPTYFVSTDAQPRVRRTADAATVITGLLPTVFGVYGAERVSPLEEAIQELAGSQPSWLGSVMSLVFGFGLLDGLGIIVAMAFGGSDRRSALRDVLIAVAGSVVVGIVLTLAIHGEWPYVLPELGLEDPTPRFPIMRAAVVTATLVAASPHLGRPLRRLGWLTIALTAMAAVSLGYGDTSDAIAPSGSG